MESGDKPGTALYLPLAVTQSLFHIDMDKEKSKEIPICATMQKNTKEAEKYNIQSSKNSQGHCLAMAIEIDKSKYKYITI